MPCQVLCIHFSNTSALWGSNYYSFHKEEGSSEREYGVHFTQLVRAEPCFYFRLFWAHSVQQEMVFLRFKVAESVCFSPFHFSLSPLWKPTFSQVLVHSCPLGSPEAKSSSSRLGRATSWDWSQHNKTKSAIQINKKTPCTHAQTCVHSTQAPRDTKRAEHNLLSKKDLNWTT